MSLRSDLNYALRAMTRSRVTSGAVILTLALGIGITTAVFSIVYGILLRPLPYPEPAEIMQVWLSNPPQDIERDITSYPNFRDWRERSRAFEAMAGQSGRRVTLTGDEGAEEIFASDVTQDFFSVLGVTPLQGRLFVPDDHLAGTAAIAVMSEELWQSRFGGQPIIGRTVAVNGTAHEVVGVLPAGVGTSRLYMPLEQNPAREGLLQARGALFLPVIGRLRDGATVENAQREMSAIAAQLANEYPDVNEGMGILVEPLRDSVTGDARSALMLLLAAVAVVLLIACANIANVLLARSTARRREMAVRVALGAGRWRLLRQVMTESLLLSFIGAIAGIGVAAWTLDLLLAAAPTELPRLDEIRLDGVALAFTLMVAVTAGLLFGAAPAWQVGRRQPGSTLGGSVRGEVGARDRLRSALVIGQYALALVLVAGASLLVRSFAELQRVDIGLEPSGVLSFSLAPSPQRYEGAAGVQSFYDEVLPAIRAVPGVQDASLLSTVFLSRLPNMGSIVLEGRQLSPALERVPVAYDAATPGMLQTLRMPLLRGRDIAPTDIADGPVVAVVNETFVERFLPDTDAVGTRFAYGQPQSDADWITIVGVVRDARRSGPTEDIRPYVFIPFQQLTERRMNVLVRTAADPMAVVPQLRSAIAAIDANVPIAELRLLQEDVDASLSTRRFLMLLIAGFGIAALVLAAVGVYGVMAYIVGRRTREIGVRMALGAAPGAVQREVIGRGMLQAGAGIALGLGLTLLLADVLRAQIYQLSPTDPFTLGGVAILLLGLAGLASWLPARRAAGVDPLVALRSD